MTEEQLLKIWSFTDADGLASPCLGKRLPEGIDRDTLADPPPLPFGLLPEDVRMAVCQWLVENVSIGSWQTVSISSQEINALMKETVKISLTDIQIREAMLLLGMEPWETDGEWTYRLQRDCPAAHAVLEGRQGRMFCL